MTVVTWGAHARSLVNYDKARGMVTYHDPYYGGVDIVCSFEDFIKNNPHFDISKISAPTTMTSSKLPSASSSGQKTDVRKTSAAAQTKSSSSESKSLSTAKLSIPPGYREFAPAFGRRRIIGPNNEIMTEINGKWVKRNY